MVVCGVSWPVARRYTAEVSVLRNLFVGLFVVGAVSLNRISGLLGQLAKWLSVRSTSSFERSIHELRRYREIIGGFEPLATPPEDSLQALLDDDFLNEIMTSWVNAKNQWTGSGMRIIPIRNPEDIRLNPSFAHIAGEDAGRGLDLVYVDDGRLRRVRTRLLAISASLVDGYGKGYHVNSALEVLQALEAEILLLGAINQALRQGCHTAVVPERLVRPHDLNRLAKEYDLTVVPLAA